MACIKLYTQSQRQKIDGALARRTAFDERIQTIEKWNALLSGGIRYLDIEYLEDVKWVKKLLIETPKITNKEIAEYISRYMSHKDVNWLV